MPPRKDAAAKKADADKIKDPVSEAPAPAKDDQPDANAEKSAGETPDNPGATGELTPPVEPTPDESEGKDPGEDAQADNASEIVTDAPEMSLADRAALIKSQDLLPRDEVEKEIAAMPEGPDKEKALELFALVYDEPAVPAADSQAEVTLLDVAAFLEKSPAKNAADDLVASMPEGHEKHKARDLVDGFFAEAPATPFIKSGGRTLRVRGFFGTYRDAVFMDEDKSGFGVCKGVTDETLAALKSDFPNAEIEEID